MTVAPAQLSADDTAMSAAEIRAYRAGVEAVRRIAKERLEDHQARVRRAPHKRWSVTIGFLGGFGRIVDCCDALIVDADAAEVRP